MAKNLVHFALHQRDLNAAVNIKTEALKVLREAEENLEKSESLSKGSDSVLIL